MGIDKSTEQKCGYQIYGISLFRGRHGIVYDLQKKQTVNNNICKCMGESLIMLKTIYFNKRH